jgi:hypothetical protein
MKVYLAVVAALVTVGIIGGVIYAVASHHSWQPNSTTCAASNLTAGQLNQCFQWQESQVGQ